jgi:diacylglycerol kinase (ATP)
MKGNQVMAYKHALMVYNPVSGKRFRHKQFSSMIQELSNLKYELDLYQTTDQGNNLKAKVKKACHERWDAIFIAGGDGTVNSVIQLISEELYRPCLGIIPFGTSNEFSKFMGIPNNMTDALSIIKKGTTKKVDIGKLGDKYFVNIAAAGWLADIIHETPAFLKSWLGESAYYLYFIKKFLTKNESHTISVSPSSNQLLEGLSFFMILNGNSVGPFKQLIPETADCNGKFHLITCSHSNRLKLFYTLLAQLFHLPDVFSLVTHHTISSSKVFLPKGMPINLDGEKNTINQLYFQVIPEHIRVFVP